MASGERADLKQQAFARCACAHACRLHVLQVAQSDSEVIYVGVRLRGQELRDFLERLRQVAVVVEGVDQHAEQGAVTAGKVRERELLVQVLAKRQCFGRHERPVRGLVVVAAGSGGGREIGLPVVAPRLRRLARRGRRNLRRA
jgi:hypothetical protein